MLRSALFPPQLLPSQLYPLPLQPHQFLSIACFPSVAPHQQSRFSIRKQIERGSAEKLLQPVIILRRKGAVTCQWPVVSPHGHPLWSVAGSEWAEEPCPPGCLSTGCLVLTSGTCNDTGCPPSYSQDTPSTSPAPCLLMKEEEGQLTAPPTRDYTLFSPRLDLPERDSPTRPLGHYFRNTSTPWVL